jgi:hypothetical protein
METDRRSINSFNYQYDVHGKRLSFIPELLYEHKINDLNNLTVGVIINYAKTNNNYNQVIMKKDHSDSYDILSYAQFLGRYKNLSYQIGLGGNIVTIKRTASLYERFYANYKFSLRQSIILLLFQCRTYSPYTELADMRMLQEN